MPGFDYSKWDNIELSDDEEVHPNIDKDSWVRMRHKDRVEREEDENNKRRELGERLAKVRDELKVFGEAGKGHLKAKKLQEEADRLNAELETMDKNRKWNADNMCQTVSDKVAVSGPGADVGPEPRLKGEAAAAGYCEFVEEHEDLLEQYIALGSGELEEVRNFLMLHGGVLLQGEHAETYLLLDCLEKEMNDEHEDMLLAARQSQLLTQVREYSRATGRPARDGVPTIFGRLFEHEGTQEAFQESLNTFIRRIEKRAPEKRREMDAEAAEEEEVGPGGLDPREVFDTLPKAMQEAFLTKDVARLHQIVESMPADEAKHHMVRCEESGLWVPDGREGAPPYRQ